ncbi:MAG TPA: helix-turn-helix domain-containing protein [Vicinamibacterales bacterium]|jgi:hypothetical protein
MDPLIAAAGRALAAGDPLGALKRVALREDPPALALRGVAMAQLGDFRRATALLRQAGRGFGVRDVAARARCLVAEAEVALVSHDSIWPVEVLDGARATLEAHGDFVNAAHARQLAARHLVLIGRLDAAERTLAQLDPATLPPASSTAHELLIAGIAMRRLRTRVARAALRRAGRAARRAQIPALAAEVESAVALFNEPVARMTRRRSERLLQLQDVEALLASNGLVVDACRSVVRRADTVISLATRPVLFALVRTLGEAWPGDAPRALLLQRAFGAKLADDSHRGRLRVEMGRLRRVLRPVATVNATTRGFALMPRPCPGRRRGATDVVVLARPVEEAHATVLALLADGEPWSSSALAQALGASQRTVQRTLEVLAEAGKVQAFGAGRARRWVTPPMPGFTSALLLSAPVPID